MSRISLSLPLIASLIASCLAAPLQQRNDTQECISTKLPTQHLAKSIDFTSCDASLGLPEALECGTYTVPVDWDHPEGEQFDLGLVRLPAPANSTSYIGPLFINPGGPGGEATGLVAALAGGALGDVEALFNAFDIIGLDPRGVGSSNQIKCDMSIYAENVSLFPTTQDEYDALFDKNKRLGESCRNLTGPLLEHVDTISAAKDHEAIRIALGDQPINFQGESYGSQLGAQYAALFPCNIRTLGLDGILQHSQGEAANLFIESSGYELSFTHFFSWASTNESSPLQGTDVEGLWIELLANASTSPIPAASCNDTTCRSTVSAEDFLFNAQGNLITPSPDASAPGTWGYLAYALQNASLGDASALSTTFGASNVPGLAISCLDWTHESSLTLEGVLAKKYLLEQHYPFTRGASQSWTIQHACLGWPALVQNPPKKLDIDTGDATILMVVSDADPSTALPWGVGMLEEIRNKSFIMRKGEGHTSLVLGGETTQVIGSYLITGEAPESGLITTS
ncbi:hypothetical protein K491DRAFT_619211 [Lophiostoma macrostomum CBS 122681]|uniref:Alpha/beta-hydrolase n=1 Tax=Lophiostoma macrostomum CBS 122681 TaxID=1314788 RepID=A0A6A6TQ75_9PLEO|nr:hypothetical protein K491DRAFT_619211 [Lophiostoma macrostomum CBS 122681]